MLLVRRGLMGSQERLARRDHLESRAPQDLTGRLAPPVRKGHPVQPVPRGLKAVLELQEQPVRKALQDLMGSLEQQDHKVRLASTALPVQRAHRDHLV